MPTMESENKRLLLRKSEWLRPLDVVWLRWIQDRYGDAENDTLHYAYSCEISTDQKLCQNFAPKYSAELQCKNHYLLNNVVHDSWNGNLQLVHWIEEKLISIYRTFEKMRITFFGGAKRGWWRFSLIFLLLNFGFPSTGVTDPPSVKWLLNSLR